MHVLCSDSGDSTNRTGRLLHCREPRVISWEMSRGGKVSGSGSCLSGSCTEDMIRTRVELRCL